MGDVCVIDSSISSKLVIDNLVNAKCRQEKEHYVCEVDNRVLKLSNEAFNKIRSLIEKYGGRVIKVGEYYMFQTTGMWKLQINDIKNKIKEYCETVLFTPDLMVEGITKKGEYVSESPLHMSLMPSKDSLWNYALKKTLDELNAKILLDNDIKEFFEGTVGETVYNRLYGIWVNTVGKERIDTDTYNRVEPIIKLEIDGHRVTVTKDRIIIDKKEYRIDKPALKSARRSLEILYRFLSESKEAVKRTIGGRKYHGTEGSIDAYLRAVSNSENVKVFTSDKDIILEVESKGKPNVSNVLYFPVP